MNYINANILKEKIFEKMRQTHDTAVLNAYYELIKIIDTMPRVGTPIIAYSDGEYYE